MENEAPEEDYRCPETQNMFGDLPVDKKEKHELYRPSNHTAFESFADVFCYKCKHFTDVFEDMEPCKILVKITCTDEYVDEWLQNDKGKRTCTKFKKKG